MKNEEKPDTCDQKPAPVELGARYKGIGIAAVAAAVRYFSVAADRQRDGEPPTRSAA
jgi:hypothetical protein